MNMNQSNRWIKSSLWVESFAFLNNKILLFYIARYMSSNGASETFFIFTTWKSKYNLAFFYFDQFLSWEYVLGQGTVKEAWDLFNLRVGRK